MRFGRNIAGLLAGAVALLQPPSLLGQPPDGRHPKIGYVHQGRVFASTPWQETQYPLGLLDLPLKELAPQGGKATKYQFPDFVYPALPPRWRLAHGCYWGTGS